VTQIEQNRQEPGSLVIAQNYNEPKIPEDLGYGELFATFWRNRFLFLKVFSGVLLLGIGVSLLKKPTYESYMRLLVEPNYWDKQDQKLQTDTSFKADYATQLNLMRSPKLLDRAVKELKSEYPDLTLKKLKKDYKIERLVEEQKNQEIDTKIFEGVYTSKDPIKTKKVLETLQNIYEQYNEQQQATSLKGGLSFLDQQLPVARQNAVEAETALKKFRQQNNLITPETEAKLVTQQLRDIQQNREQVQTKLRETQSRYRELQKQLGQSSETIVITSRLSESSRFQSLLDRLQRMESELEQQRSTLTDNNPTIQTLLEKQRNQRQLLKQEVKRVLGKVPAQLNLDSEALQKQGQLGQSDIKLTQELLEVQRELTTIQERDRGLAVTEAKLNNQLNRFPSLLDIYNNLKQEVEVKRETLKQLLEAKQKLGIEIDRGGFRWEVVEPPQEGLKISPNLAKDLILSGVVAGFIGCASIFTRELLDDAIRTSKQLKVKSNIPLLGEVSQLVPDKLTLPWSYSLGKEQGSYFSSLDVIQWQPVKESLDLIYTNLQMLYSVSQLKSIAITSTVPGEGKSTLSLGLALSAGRLDRKVLLIDADLRQGVLHKNLGIGNDDGLSNLLAGTTNRPNIQKISILDSNIDVLSSGSASIDPVKLLSTPKLELLIKNFEEHYDLVLVDTPPVLEMVDAIKTSSCCHGSVLVVKIDEVNKSKVEESINLLSKLNLLGTIANGLKDNKFRYSKYRSYINTSLPEARDFS
jgi:polysaccharide biosynthesis transport protein